MAVLISARDEGWAVFARVVQPTDRTLLHADWHTRDITPARTRWAALFERLTPSKQVVAEEYPLEFATELEAIVRGLAGQVAAFFKDDEFAEEHLKAALALAPASTSHQIDQLRIAMVDVLARTGRRAEALHPLRRRAEGEDPSPALLRAIHGLLGPRPGEPEHVTSEEEAREAIAALRRAAEHETDPERDLTLYNLALMLWNYGGEPGKEEANRTLAELMETSAFYRRAWYTNFHRGATYYQLALDAQAEGDQARAKGHFKHAARFYSRGIRMRPGRRFFWREGLRGWLVRRFLPSPIMYANAKDAHGGAGHRLRARWYELRYQWFRSRMLKKAYRGFDRQDWDAAYAYLDWAIVGRWDEEEVKARTLRAIASKQRGYDAMADADWAETVQRAPIALLVREAAANDMVPPLQRGVPGNEPTEHNAVMAELRKAGVI